MRLVHPLPDQVWINVHDMLKPLKNGRFLWASERSGFRRQQNWGSHLTIAWGECLMLFFGPQSLAGTF